MDHQQGVPGIAPKSVRPNEKCTIVIPTYDRPEYLERILRYYANCRTQYPIIIADTGSDESQVRNKRTASTYSTLDITHYDHPTNTEPFGGFELKILNALSKCSTEYCVVCADDDFIMPSAIGQCVQFLEHNPDYAVAHGQYLYFRVDHDVKSQKSIVWLPWYKGRSLTCPRPQSRLRYHLSHCPEDITFYAVHETALLKRVLSEVLDSELRSMMLRELCWEGMTVLLGKTRYLNVLYSAKDLRSTRLQYVPDTRRLRETGVYDAEYPQLRDTLALQLAERAALSARTSRAIVDAAMSAYLKRARIQNSIANTKENLYSTGLGWVYETIARLHRGLYEVVLGRRLAWVLLRGRVFWTNYRDLESIRSFLLNFAQAM